VNHCRHIHRRTDAQTCIFAHTHTPVQTHKHSQIHMREWSLTLLCIRTHSGRARVSPPSMWRPPCRFRTTATSCPAEETRLHNSVSVPSLVLRLFPPCPSLPPGSTYPLHRPPFSLPRRTWRCCIIRCFTTRTEGTSTAVVPLHLGDIYIIQLISNFLVSHTLHLQSALWRAQYSRQLMSVVRLYYHQVLHMQLSGLLQPSCG